MRATGYACLQEENHMRKTLLMSAALFAVGVASAYAQTSSGQTPPTPGASSQSVQPPGSLPPGASTLAPGNRGIRPVGAAPSGQDAMPPGAGAPEAGMPHENMRSHRAAHPRHYNRRGQAARDAYMDPENPGGGRAPADQYPGVPPTSAYQGGVGSPLSNRASNITGADTHSEIAPRLPNPDANGNSPQAYLAAADRALARGQTGAAQEALERAQTRILTRSTDPSMANMPDDSGMARAISDARMALANRDPGRARSIIGQILNRGG
jgi:hypothetical protein